MAYDAFISYSHSADGKLAPAVQGGLQRLARPWYRRRALRVFRDETGLSVNPHLWRSIEQALDESRFFVLLASPQSAASPWVDRELRHWLTTHDADTVLPVLTEGTLSWDADRGDFDATFSSALPPALYGAYGEEPRHLDLRWARDETDLDLRHSRFRSQIAELAAPMHGRPKDDLESDDIHQHRRALRLAWAAGIALLALTSVAVVLSIVAFTTAAQARENEEDAIAQQHRADAEADLARRRGAEVASANAELDQANSTLKATNRELAATNDELTAQTAQTEEQRQQALRNADEARKNADAAKANAERATQNADEAARQRDAANENLAQANANLLRALFFEQTARVNEGQAKANEARALRQEDLTEQQRVAGVARQLVLGSSAARQAGNIDRALLLGVEAKRFADRAGGVSGLDLQQPLIDALGQDPALIGYLHGLDGFVSTVAVSPDGELVSAGATVSTTEMRVGIWRLSDRRLLARFDAPFSAGPIVAFTGARALVVGGAGADHLDAYVGSPDARTWTRAWTWPPSGGGVLGPIAASAQGTFAVGGLSGGFTISAHVLDSTGRETATIQSTPNGFPQHLAISRDGLRIAMDDGPASGDPPATIGHIYGLDNAVVATLTTSAPTAPAVTHMQFAADGAELAVLVAGDPPLHRFDVATGAEQAEPPRVLAGSVPSYPIGISPSLDRVVQRYGARSATDPTGDLLGVGFLSSGSFVGSLDAPLARPLPAGAGNIGAPAFTPDGTTIVAAGGDGSIPVFLSPELAEPRFSTDTALRQTRFSTFAVALSPGGTVAVALEPPSGDQSVVMHLVPLTPTEQRHDIVLPPQPTSPPSSATQVAFGDASDLVAVGYSNGAVELWNASTGNRLLQLAAPQTCNSQSPSDPQFPILDRPCQLAVTGTIAAAIVIEASAGHIHTWDIGNGAVTAENDTSTPDDGVPSAALLARTGSRLVINTNEVSGAPPFVGTSTAHVYVRTSQGWTRQRALIVDDHAFGITSLSLSHDGNRLTVAVPGEPIGSPEPGGLFVRSTLYDLDRGTPLWEVPNALMYDADGRLLLSIETKGVTVRSPDTGTSLGTLTFPTTPATLVPMAIAQRADRIIVLAGTLESVGDLHELNLQPRSFELGAVSCDLAGRNLAPAEWSQYVGTADERERTCAAFP